MNRLFNYFRIISWRLGRGIYARARGDVAADPKSNGEYFLLRKLFSILPPQTYLMVDVGANKGEWTLRAIEEATKNNSMLRLHLFEPARDSYALLRQKFDNKNEVTVNRLAVAERSGNVRLKISGECAGTNTLFGGSELKPIRTEEISAIRLDEYEPLIASPSIALMKIDVEGADYLAILGSINLFIEEKIEICQFEYNHRWIYSRCFLKDIFDLIPLKTYAIGKLHNDWIEVFSSWHPELERYFEGNYLVIKRNHSILSSHGKICRFNKFNAPSVKLIKPGW